MVKVMREASMAFKVQKLLEQSNSLDDRFLIMCGNQHMERGFGLPEHLSKVKDQTFLVHS